MYIHNVADGPTGIWSVIRRAMCMYPDKLWPIRACRKGDIFVHADLQGAPVTIIKSPDPATPVPPLTISQASP